MKYPNIVFIVLDTLRKDYAKPLESELKKLGFISYENAIAPAPWTTPSHASMFTGLYPAFHGAHETKDKKTLDVKLKFSDTLLTIILKDFGYENYLITSNFLVHPRCGFRGFDYIYETFFLPLLPIEQQKLKKIKQNYKPNTKIGIFKTLLVNKYINILIKEILNYVDDRTKLLRSVFKNWPRDKGARDIVKYLKTLEIPINRNKFIFINLTEVHEPYCIFEKSRKENINNLKKNEIRPTIVKCWRRKYPEQVKYVSRRVMDMIKIFKEKNIFDDSLIIVTSDHGQLLGEHNRITHGTFLYDELLRVPLLIKYPEYCKIERVYRKSMYISLTKLKPLILRILENKITEDALLYEHIVFAESYGTHTYIGDLSNDNEKKNIENLEKYRIAVYHRNFKGIFNVTDWKFENIFSYNPKSEVTEEVVKEMKKEVLKFLKTVSVAKVPKIKI